jgi:hypothetical protein
VLLLLLLLLIMMMMMMMMMMITVVGSTDNGAGRSLNTGVKAIKNFASSTCNDETFCEDDDGDDGGNDCDNTFLEVIRIPEATT